MSFNKQRKTERAIKTFSCIIASDNASRKLKNFKAISRAPLSNLIIFCFYLFYRCKKYGI